MASRNLILASASPRRRELLSLLDIPFTVVPADISEEPLPREKPEALVLRLAEDKARAVSRLAPEALVIAADTIVVLEAPGPAQILGKPADAPDAVKMLSLLQGQEHTVLTGFCLLSHSAKVFRSRVVSTKVRMKTLTAAEIEAYVATGEPLDKAGAYAVQGRGATFIEAVYGSYTNVVGLPMAELFDDLRDIEHLLPGGLPGLDVAR